MKDLLTEFQEAIAHQRLFNEDCLDAEPLMVMQGDSCYELPTDDLEGKAYSSRQLTFGDLCKLVSDYCELKHRMDGLEK